MGNINKIIDDAFKDAEENVKARKEKEKAHDSLDSEEKLKTENIKVAKHYGLFGK